MKTIVKNGVYQRLDNAESEVKVKSGWKYCPKSEWKSNVRDFDKSEVEEMPERKRSKRK